MEHRDQLPTSPAVRAQQVLHRKRSYHDDSFRVCQDYFYQQNLQGTWYIYKGVCPVMGTESIATREPGITHTTFERFVPSMDPFMITEVFHSRESQRTH